MFWFLMLGFLVGVDWVTIFFFYFRTFGLKLFVVWFGMVDRGTSN